MTGDRWERLVMWIFALGAVLCVIGFVLMVLSVSGAAVRAWGVLLKLAGAPLVFGGFLFLPDERECR